MKDVCGNLAETLATADLVVLEVGVVGEEADDLVSPVLVDAVAVVPEWWVFVALFAAAALFVVLAFMILDFNLKNLKKETFSTSHRVWIHTESTVATGTRSRSIYMYI